MATGSIRVFITLRPMGRSARTALRDNDLGFERSQLRLRTDQAQLVVLRGRNSADTRIRDLLATIATDVTMVTIDRHSIETLSDLAPDVVVIDDGGGEFDVMRLCRDLHDSMGSRVIVVGAEQGTYTDEWVIDLLDAGADDFIPRTASDGLLLARVRVAIRTMPSMQRRSRQLVVGDVIIDLDAHEFFIAGERGKCPPRQFLLLVALASQPNRVVTRDALLASVWGAAPGSVDARRLRIAVSLLRARLGRGPERPTIETVSHVGYRLVVDDGEVATDRGSAPGESPQLLSGE
jgi:DNA-binding response OmpR family regulator